MILFTLRMLHAMARGALTTQSSARAAVRHRNRLWPMDVDIFMHMNNAQYVRVAELARWEIFSNSGFMRPALQNKWMFLVAEQNVRYMRPIAPFQTYVLRTQFRQEDDKWLFYRHTFENERGDREFCVVDVKAVVKEPSGRTVRPSELGGACSWTREHLESSDNARKNGSW
eukprot:scaffold251_cov230-Pinguiococcus_pyrenoidosus.AAC.5